MRVASALLPAAFAVLLGCGSPSAAPPSPAPEPPAPAAKTVRVGSRDLVLSGPFVHGSLALFALSGEATDAREFLSLDQGLGAGTVVMAEKGTADGRDAAQVNELVLENRSDRWLFLQAGDVVKGGKQDRVVAQDLVVPPHAAPQPLAAFCVEHGRWQAEGDYRGRGEILFTSNTALVNGPELKRAIQAEGDQQRVWAEVAQVNQDIELQGSAGGMFMPSATGTYNSVLSNKEVVGRRDAAVHALLDRVLEGGRAVGMAVAIGERVVGVETYASPGLFRAMARKLVESYALDAVLAERPGAATPPPTGAEAVRAFLAEAGKGAGKDEALRGSMRRRVLETSIIMGYEYRVFREETPEDAAIHASYIRK